MATCQVGAKSVVLKAVIASPAVDLFTPEKHFGAGPRGIRTKNRTDRSYLFCGIAAYSQKVNRSNEPSFTRNPSPRQFESFASAPVIAPCITFIVFEIAVVCTP